MPTPPTTPSPAEIIALVGPDIDRGSRLLILYVITCVLSFVAVALRFWARYKIRALGSDDWCMLATWILYVPLTVLTSIIALNGGTRHLVYLSQDVEKAVWLTKLNWISQVFAIACGSLGKVAIGLLVVRLLDRTSTYRKWSLHVCSGWLIANGIMVIIVNFSQCKKVDAVWDPRVRATTSCWKPTVQSNAAIYSGSVNTAADFFLAFLPLTMVWNLKLSLQIKAGLALLLGCGVVTGIISALKTSYLANLGDSDLTWSTYILYIYTGIEIVLIIVLGSVAPLRAFWSGAYAKSVRTTKYYAGSGATSTARSKSTRSKETDALDYPLVQVSAMSSKYDGQSGRNSSTPERIHVTHTIEHRV